MNNIKLVIEYDGTDYAGWQQQKKQKTVLGTLKQAIEKAVNEKVKLHGAGRTDSGVHAIGQVADFKTKSTVPTSKLAHAINYFLPEDIVVKSARKVPDSFHSRYSAKSKTYRYTILNNTTDSVLNRNFHYRIIMNLDIEKMKKAANALIGKHDFSTFKSKSSVINNVRTIKKLEIREKGKYLYITVEANGFLYKMVRSIVGTLLDVGKGTMTITEFKRALKSRDRSLAGDSVLAKGLCLIRVKY